MYAVAESSKRSSEICPDLSFALLSGSKKVNLLSREDIFRRYLSLKIPLRCRRTNKKPKFVFELVDSPILDDVSLLF